MFITTVLATICAALIALAIYLNSKVAEPNKLNHALSLGLKVILITSLLPLIAGWVGLIKGAPLFSEDQGQVTGQMISQYPAPVS